MPRIETPHHRDAVGSYGGLVVDHAATYGLTLRWWQEYVFWRLLEHDADGRLLWFEAAFSVARQVGKGVGGIRPLCEWRLDAAELFGEPQTTIHVAHQVNIAMEIATPALARHKELGHKIRLTNGEQSIERPDGSRWLMRSTSGAYGFSSSMVNVDEVWAVKQRVVDSMLLPTMLARRDPQLVMWSTANVDATSTYQAHRETSGEADGRLVVEWSAPPEAEKDLGNRDYWRLASPHWDDQRERMLTRQLSKVSREHFATNFLNMWPATTAAETPFPNFEALPSAPPEPRRGGIFVIEESRDGAKFQCLRLVGGAAYYTETASLADAVVLGNTADSVIVGYSLGDAAVKAGLRLPPVRYGLRHLSAFTPLLLSTVAGGTLAHNHHPELLLSAKGAVVLETESGRALSAKRSDYDAVPLKILAWALGYRRAADSAPRARVW
jgi:hypothetical protein